MRPLFMDFSLSDPYTLDVTEALKLEYMFGPRLLVSPVTTYQATEATVYLPALPSSAPDTKWTYWWTNQTFSGGQWVSFYHSPLLFLFFFFFVLWLVYSDQLD
jgi:alpha-D-xyloside xylohydrolase